MEKVASVLRKKNGVKRPSLIWSLTEISRAFVEMGFYFPFKALKKFPQNGDGHPVLILPGFLASDASTVPLRNFVHELGYTVYGWGEGRNYANEEYLELLFEKVESLYKKHQEPISLVGWSLGGIYARQLAKGRPHMIRQVMTLGSPFKGVTRANNAKWMYDLLTRGEGTAKIDPELIEDIPHPAPVPTTAVYSKQDGIVPWQLCMEQEESFIHQNIQVHGSHFGLGVNPAVFMIIADRLQYHEENWTSFKPDNLFQDLLLFPSTKVNFE